MVLLVPRALCGDSVEVLPLKHPGDGSLAQFAIKGSKAYAVLNTNQHSSQTHTRSLLISPPSNEFVVPPRDEPLAPAIGYISHDSQIQALIPVNASFFVLPLVIALTEPISIKEICQSFETELTRALPLALALAGLEKLGHISSQDIDGLFTANMSKIKDLLTKVLNLEPPHLLALEYERLIKPINGDEIEPDMLKLMHRYSALSFASVWMSTDVYNFCKGLYDFQPFIDEIEKLNLARKEARAVQEIMNAQTQSASNKKKAPAKKAGKAAPKAKQAPANNKSLLAMWGKKN